MGSILVTRARWYTCNSSSREVSWQDKITVRDVNHAGKWIRIFGC